MRNRGLSFKIIPRNRAFLIGSDDSNGRGTVVKID
jgi:hypothetical protein